MVPNHARYHLRYTPQYELPETRPGSFCIIMTPAVLVKKKSRHCTKISPRAARGFRPSAQLGPRRMSSPELHKIFELDLCTATKIHGDAKGRIDILNEKKYSFRVY